MSGVGGGVRSPFSGFQSCQGKTLNSGASCQMVYSFSPTSAGAASTTSSGDWNGQNFSITLTALGIVAATPPPQLLLSPARLQSFSSPAPPISPPPPPPHTHTPPPPPPLAL